MSEHRTNAEPAGETPALRKPTPGPTLAKTWLGWGTLLNFGTLNFVILNFLTLSFVILGMTLLPAFAQTVRHHQVAEPTPDSLATAEAAIEKQDWTAAESDLKQAVAKDSNDYRAWYDLGFVYSQTGRRPEAIEAYRQSVAANPAIFESTLNLGILLAQEHNRDAEAFLRAATQLKPASKPDASLEHAWLALGHFLEDNRPKDALSAFSQAKLLVPKDAEPHLSRAIVFEKLGDLGNAEDEFHAAADLDPQSTEALAGLANIYSKTNRFPEAEAALRKLVALESPTSAKTTQISGTQDSPTQNSHPQEGATGASQFGAAHIQLGRVLAAEGKNDEAAAELRTGLKLAPDPAAQRDAAEVYLAAGKFPEAEAQFRQVLQQDPSSAEAHYGLGRALMQQKKFAEAQPELLAALQRDPKLGQAYGDLAIVASANQDYPLAIRALDARSRLLPEIPATFFLRATAYDHLRDREHAVEYYRRFLDAANGKFPDQEWQARHRLQAIEKNKK